MYKLKITSILVIFLLFLNFSTGVLAQEDVTTTSSKNIVTWTDVLDVAKEVRPPGCTHSMTADYCTLQVAHNTRNEIAELLMQGMSKQEVLNTLVDKYGEQILAAPTKKGFNLLIWILPSASLLSGALLITKFINSWLKKERYSKENIVEDKSVSLEDQQKVEDELKDWI